MIRNANAETLADHLTIEQLESLYFKPNGFGSSALLTMIRDLVSACDRMNIAERALASRYNSIEMRNVVNGTNDVPVFRATHIIEAALEDYFQANKAKLGEGLSNLGIDPPKGLETFDSGAKALVKARFEPLLQAAFGPIEARNAAAGRS